MDARLHELERLARRIEHDCFTDAERETVRALIDDHRRAMQVRHETARHDEARQAEARALLVERESILNTYGIDDPELFACFQQEHARLREALGDA